eukprot:NODE_230_length_13723_cov_0.393570.p5 type:complete len:263 gc:universal NODE_230_length_13723_cov_0.393570:12997-12209(-)
MSLHFLGINECIAKSVRHKQGMMRTLSAEVSAFVSRLKLPKEDIAVILSNPPTNPVGPFHDGKSTNSAYKGLGKSTIHTVIYEHIMNKWPKSSENMIENGAQAYMNNDTLSKFAQQLGVHRIYNEFNETKMQKGDLRNIVYALIGYFTKTKGLEYTRKFINDMLISNSSLKLNDILKIDDPHKLLQEKLNCKLNYKILKESGRFSHSPIFEVGCFNEKTLLGLGVGSSIKMAQHRSSMDYLIKFYQGRDHLNGADIAKNLTE